MFSAGYYDRRQGKRNGPEFRRSGGAMEDNRTAFGRMPDGTQVDQITLKNGDMACRIIT